MLQGKLPLNQEIAMYFQGINWKKINTEYKNKFSEAVSQIMGGLKEKGIDCNKIEGEIQKVYQEIGRLTIQTKRSSIRPPK